VIRGRSLCDLPRWAVGRLGALGMPVDPGMLNSVVRITGAGDLLGTGSIVNVESETVEGLRWPYIVTAHHVISNQVEIGLEVADPLTRGEMFPPIPSDEWRQPLDGIDLAIAPFPRSLVARYQGVHLEHHFVPEDTVVPLGGQIYYVGVFAPLDVPMCRPANLGALDVRIDKDDYVYRADLVDCRSYGGFSGSPCFATIEYAVLDEPLDAMPGQIPRSDGSLPKLGQVAHLASFCGIFTAHFSDEVASAGIVSRYGVGVMLPCDYVRDALMTDEAKEERRLADEEWKRRKASEQPPLENAGVEVESEFERFEDLARTLAQTPKPRDS
jgi:hypothetical protein